MEDSKGGTPLSALSSPKTEKTKLVSEDSAGSADGKRSSCRNCMTPNAALLPFKVFYMSFFGAIGSLMPYMAIYFKQMGLGPEQIGLIAGIRPLAGFCSGPFWGAVADRFHVRRLVLLLSMVAWIGFYLGLGFVPSASRSGVCPKEVLDASQTQIRVSRETETALHHHRPKNFLNRSTSAVDLYKEDIGWVYEPRDLYRVFVTFLLLILFGELFQSPTSALADAGTLEELGEQDIESYGNQRAWGSIGFGVSSFLVGFLVSQSRHSEVICGIKLIFSDYMLPFYVFSGLMAAAFISALFFKFQEDKERMSSKKLGKAPVLEKSNPIDVFRVFLCLHHASWLAASYFMGVSNGVIWGFLYWHLENLGASQLLMGVASGLSCLSEFLMFFFVHPLINLLGYMGVLYFGLFCYAVRFCVYAVLVNPWLVLPAEILQGITFASVWVSLTSYSTMTVPRTSLGTIQGVMHGVYWGLGSGTGHMIGGLLISYFGAAVTFLGMAVASVVVLILFVCAQMVGQRPGYSELSDTSVPDLKSKSNMDKLSPTDGDTAGTEQ